MICFAGSAELLHDEEGFSLPSRREAEGALSPGKTNEKGGSCKDWREVHGVEGRPPWNGGETSIPCLSWPFAEAAC